MASQKEPPRPQLASHFHRFLDARPVARRSGWEWRPFRPLTPIRKVISQDYVTGAFKSSCEAGQQRGTAIRSGPVREHQHMAIARLRPVQDARHTRGFEGLFHQHPRLGSSPQLLFFLEKLVVFGNELADIVRHAKQLFPLLAVQSHRKAS
jgi:hypothetical protein